MSSQILDVQRAPARATYDGASPFDGERPRASALQIGVTLTLVVVPLVGTVLAGLLLWNVAFSPVDLLLAVLLYFFTGLGVAIGFHRGFTHRSFAMRPSLRLLLASAGSMAFEGSVIAWVATHRRHHAFTDRPGDPHSPHRYGSSFWGQVRGLAHAHLGWLFVDDPTSPERYAPDLVADPQIRRIDRAFPLFCVISLALPAVLGLAITGSWWGAATAFLWAGLVRVALLQHVTWSVNSLCHMFGKRPHETRAFDRSTNLWPLAIVSFGESWHNGHHAAPACARHGRGARQFDLSATVIRWMEQANWVSDVRWTAGGPRDDNRVVKATAFTA